MEEGGFSKKKKIEKKKDFFFEKRFLKKKEVKYYQNLTKSDRIRPNPTKSDQIPLGRIRPHLVGVL